MHVLYPTGLSRLLESAVYATLVPIKSFSHWEPWEAVFLLWLCVFGVVLLSVIAQEDRMYHNGVIAWMYK